ncbi:MAG: hypothetical protein QM786_15975 [Breznakibacter sp.]
MKKNLWNKLWGYLNGADFDGDGIYTGGLNENFTKLGILPMQQNKPITSIWKRYGHFPTLLQGKTIATPFPSLSSSIMFRYPIGSFRISGEKDRRNIEGVSKKIGHRPPHGIPSSISRLHHGVHFAYFGNEDMRKHREGRETRIRGSIDNTGQSAFYCVLIPDQHSPDV